MVMLLAVSVTIHSVPHHHADEIGSDEFLEKLEGIKLRVCDVTSMDDESIVYLTDLLAHPIDDEGPCEFLCSILDSVYGQNGYHLILSSDDFQRSFGTDGFCRLEYSSSVRLTDGGTLDIVLGIL